jgi:DNA-binding transcriptional LysR family regulator
MPARVLHPSIRSLLAFVAAARHRSISGAAGQLHLTQSAVSKQVLELERLIGHRLFERTGRRLELTPTGERYLAQLHEPLRAIEAATLEAMAHGDVGGSLRLSSLATFSAKWLIPRLPRFHAAHPQLRLDFLPVARRARGLATDEFPEAALDCAIRYGKGRWPGMVADYLVGHENVLIAPPAVRDIARPEDVRTHTLLHHADAPAAWAHWCAAHGVAGLNAMGGPRFDQVNSLIQAVMAGLGVALVPRCLAELDLAAGLVRAPLEEAGAPPFLSDEGYHLVYAPGRAQLPALAAFRAWLLDEASAGG